MTHSLTLPASRRDILRGGAALGLLAGLPPGLRSAHAQTAPVGRHHPARHSEDR